MTHYMKLNPQPFDMISSRLKTIELRLNDEKRRKININDVILFTNTLDSSQQITVKVINIYKFTTFVELYKSLPLDKCGYLPHELPTASPSDMEEYYSIDEQNKYGVLGIEVKLI